MHVPRNPSLTNQDRLLVRLLSYPLNGALPVLATLASAAIPLFTLGALLLPSHEGGRMGALAFFSLGLSGLLLGLYSVVLVERYGQCDLVLATTIRSLLARARKVGGDLPSDTIALARDFDRVGQSSGDLLDNARAFYRTHRGLFTRTDGSVATVWSVLDPGPNDADWANPGLVEDLVGTELRVLRDRYRHNICAIDLIEKRTGALEQRILVLENLERVARRERSHNPDSPALRLMDPLDLDYLAREAANSVALAAELSALTSTATDRPNEADRSAATC